MMCFDHLIGERSALLGTLCLVSREWRRVLQDTAVWRVHAGARGGYKRAVSSMAWPFPYRPGREKIVALQFAEEIPERARMVLFRNFVSLVCDFPRTLAAAANAKRTIVWWFDVFLQTGNLLALQLLKRNFAITTGQLHVGHVWMALENGHTVVAQWLCREFDFTDQIADEKMWIFGHMCRRGQLGSTRWMRTWTQTTGGVRCGRVGTITCTSCGGYSMCFTSRMVPSGRVWVGRDATVTPGCGGSCGRL